MDKISGIFDNTQIHQKQKNHNTDNSEFQETFKRSLNIEKEQEVTNASVESLQEISSVWSTTIIDENSTGYIGQADEILDLLYEYKTNLEDPLKNMKDIETVISEYKTRADQLIDKISGMKDIDENFLNIARELSVNANVEYLKFYRGDYI